MKRRRSLLLLPLLLLTGCSAMQDRINQSSLDFATGVGGDYLDYVDADVSLDATQKSTRHLRVEAQKDMLKEALGHGNE